MRHAFVACQRRRIPWQTTTRAPTTPIPLILRDPARVAAPEAAAAEVAAAEVAAASVDPVAAAAAGDLEEAPTRAAPAAVAMVEAVTQDAAAAVAVLVEAVVDPQAAARVAWVVR